ncbi:hypothetical protein F5Y15DRAFT_60270 [Xylariaceae sp. FL0016]|nr:hypothetical protein F5Y15DRAFT_60270 [Xylariaceae sp. FL0016]
MMFTFLSHSVERPYPVKWLTPIIIIGTLAFVVIAAFLGISTSGYELVPIESDNPNATVKEQVLFSSWPSYLTANTQASCTPVTIGGTGQYFTNNTALLFTIKSVLDGNATDVQSQNGELIYQSHLPRNCTIPVIQMNYHSKTRTAIQIARQRWGVELVADIKCIVETGNGAKVLKLSTDHDFNRHESRFSGRNKTIRPSLWWGESPLVWYYLKATRYMSLYAKEESLDKGYFEMAQNFKDTASIPDPESTQFFKVGCFFTSDKNNPYCSGHPPSLLSSGLAGQLGASSDFLAKAFYFTILTNLGQFDDIPNILVDPHLLETFSKNISYIRDLQATDEWGKDNNLKWDNFHDLANTTFDVNETSQWNLGVDPTVLSMTYNCQSPRLNKVSSLIVSVFIAVYVLLQVLLKLLKIGIDFILVRKYPNLNVCLGCAANTGSSPRSVSVYESSICKHGAKTV